MIFSEYDGRCAGASRAPMREEVQFVVISSLVVETVPDYTQKVADELALKQGVEVHGIDSYKIIITIETPTVDESHAIANSLVPITGVIGVDLIYLNFEDDPTIYPDGV